MNNKIWVGGYILKGLGVFLKDIFSVGVDSYVASFHYLYQVLRVDK